MNLSKNRWFSVMPMLCAVGGAPVGGILVDLLRRRFSLQLSMKITHSIGILTAAGSILVVGLVPNLPFPAVVALLALTFVFAAFFSATVLRGATGIKPKFSRFISGLVGTAGWTGFLISPYVVENVTKNHKKSEWSFCFCLLAASFFLSWLVYLPIRFQDQKSTAAVAPMAPAGPASFGNEKMTKN